MLSSRKEISSNKTKVWLNERSYQNKENKSIRPDRKAGRDCKGEEVKTINYRGKIKNYVAVGYMNFGKVKKLAQNDEIVQVKGIDCTRMGKYYDDFGMIRIEFIGGINENKY